MYRGCQLLSYIGNRSEMVKSRRQLINNSLAIWIFLWQALMNSKLQLKKVWTENNINLYTKHDDNKCVDMVPLYNYIYIYLMIINQWSITPLILLYHLLQNYRTHLPQMSRILMFSVQASNIEVVMLQIHCQLVLTYINNISSTYIVDWLRYSTGLYKCVWFPVTFKITTIDNTQMCNVKQKITNQSI